MPTWSAVLALAFAVALLVATLAAAVESGISLLTPLGLAVAALLLIGIWGALRTPPRDR